MTGKSVIFPGFPGAVGTLKTPPSNFRLYTGTIGDFQNYQMARAILVTPYDV